VVNPVAGKGNARRVWERAPLALSRDGVADWQCVTSEGVGHACELARAAATAGCQLCARLDGLPLAIEVAAAHSKVLTPVALFARLEHRLTLLVRGPRDQPPRHQTLRATLDWSYNLLAPELRKVFRRLGVFTGGCTLEAVAAVCNLRDAFGAVGSLVDHSLLQQQSRPDGIPRFAMLETMREYALEQLVKEGEADEARRAHADYFLSLCEQASPRLTAGGERASLLRQLEPDEDNLLAALRWCVDAGEVERGLRLGGAGSRYCRP
jgi:predicted ATPase